MVLIGDVYETILYAV